MIIPLPPSHEIYARSVPIVPFYSQFTDIHLATWKKVGCGITSLAMIIEYYNPGAVTVDKLLQEGIVKAAYDPYAGWIHSGLVALSKKYGLTGQSHDLRSLSQNDALYELQKYTDQGPVMVSIHYKFDPKSSIPHIIVIDGIRNDIVYYNDPAAKGGQKEISSTTFKNAWKKKFIVLRPIKDKGMLV